MSEDATIHEFARRGDTAGVQTMLDQGVAVDVREAQFNRTPLMEAACSPAASVELVRLLIARGADVNAVAVQTTEFIADEATELPEADPADTFSAEVLQTLQQARELLRSAPRTPKSVKCVLSFAIREGNLQKVEAILDAGADVRYVDPSGYDALIDAVHTSNDAGKVVLLTLLIARGAGLNGESAWGESAVRVASHRGQFEIVRMLLQAGADETPLGWTPLMHAVALGSLEDVRALLTGASVLAERDSWERTPFLLSVCGGDVPKARALLDAGADRSDRGRCDQTALAYAAELGRAEMLRWMLSEGFDPNETDDSGGTPLLEAAESGHLECVDLLIKGGADIRREQFGETALALAANLDIVRRLVNAGADLNDIGAEMRAALTGLAADGEVDVSRDEYLAQKNRRFGASNPERMNLSFWRAMVTSGGDAWHARQRFDDTNIESGSAVWCFKRFGKSITELPDGRIIEIAGEHEDSYDPDFCIYNDVVVHHGNGVFDIFGYPEDVFPPTDFHTATLVGGHIYIIGSLGYHGRRAFGMTPVYRLDVDSLVIEKLETSGAMPGWIHRHAATLMADGRIRVTGGEIASLADGREQHVPNGSSFLLDIESRCWSCAGRA